MPLWMVPGPGGPEDIRLSMERPDSSWGFSTVAVSPSSGHCSLLVTNIGGGAQNSKTVALSHWPVNSSGNATATVWQLGTQSQGYTANDPATVTSVQVNAGVTAPMNFPDPSVTIISV
jgi:hypothetical protein